MSFADLLRPWRKKKHNQPDRDAILRRADELAGLSDSAVREKAMSFRQSVAELPETFAVAVEVARRALGLRMFPVQVSGALSLQRGEIAEMQTGEGKTLAAVPAVIWFALQGKGVHVLTANEYLAARDALWMGPIYGWFGLTCSPVGQAQTRDERRRAYACDITYATANEVGFDYLRDGLAQRPEDLTGLRFGYALIDEADSILLDEARIPLVIAGGNASELQVTERADKAVRELRETSDFLYGEHDRIVRLTDLGIALIERAFRCGNLFDERNLPILTAVQDALHARGLLRRDVDYLVKDGKVELIDESKGRVERDRRWPAGLQSAIEAKEGLTVHQQGRILGSITVQNLIGLYAHVSGMTGTAATQAEDFWKMYKLPVTVLPTNKPCVRQDLPDLVFKSAEERDRAVVDEVRRVHAVGRPVLIGTASVADSERLSGKLRETGIAHSILNAYRDEAEAQIIAQAGDVGAVTISTNMAGRGTDIFLGGNPPIRRDKVVLLGGLYVIGTTRHEARRIDYQLRGRAGRQGDPGSSQFFLSLEDGLLVRFGVAENPDIDSVQRTAESENLQIRELLWKYESVLEHHRREMRTLRDRLLSGEYALLAPIERVDQLARAAGRAETEAATQRLLLAVLDDLWADYIANVAELKGGIHWVSWGGRDPLYEFLTGAERIYEDLQDRLDEEVRQAFEKVTIEDGRIVFAAESELDRGATWTYLTTDQPFGSFGQRVMRGILRVAKRAAQRR